MASGVAVRDECKEAFKDIKLGHAYKYIVFKLSDDLKEIEVEKTAPITGTYEEFTQDMMDAAAKKECRYAIYDFEYITGNGQTKSKLVFFMWNPPDAKIKMRMVYSSSKDALKKALSSGIAKEIQACDAGDLEWDSVLEVIKRTERA